MSARILAVAYCLCALLFLAGIGMMLANMLGWHLSAPIEMFIISGGVGMFLTRYVGGWLIRKTN